MEQKKQANRLGRGLSALFGDEIGPASEAPLPEPQGVPIELIHTSTLQPRQAFDDDTIEALAQSIRSSGMLQPILVRRHPKRAGEFEIVAGERRWRAAQRAQLHVVPAVVRELSDRQLLEIAVVENVQRQDLSPLEEAGGYRRLIDDFGHTQEELAAVIGKSRSHIANLLRLLNLPEAVKTLLSEGKITAGHARALLNAVDPEALAGKIVAEGLNVRQVERLVQLGKARAAERGAGRHAAGKDADTLALERSLSRELGLKVAIKAHGDGGALTIHYARLEQLDDVLRRLNQPVPGAA
jgi:ParB family chromosome partitioning protein